MQPLAAQDHGKCGHHQMLMFVKQPVALGLQSTSPEASCFHLCRYLSDHASVDAISSKLREVCPSLYRNEDAACSKVTAICLRFQTQPCHFPELACHVLKVLTLHKTVCVTVPNIFLCLALLQANEMLLSAKSIRNPEERETKLRDALQVLHFCLSSVHFVVEFW